MILSPPCIIGTFCPLGILLKNGFPVGETCSSADHTQNFCTTPDQLENWNQQNKNTLKCFVHSKHFLLSHEDIKFKHMVIIWAKIERGLNHHFNCIRLDFFIFCTCSYLENDCLLPPFRSYPLLRPNNGCTKNFISRPIIYRTARKKKTIIIPR